MGFTHYPGPLPFATIRDTKWANRLTVGELVQIQGEHGCKMDKQPARVERIEGAAECPAHLAGIYGRRSLCAVHLAPVAANDPELKRYGFPV